ncbi:MAG: hypothetical protein PHV59_02175 [Victivallales bacterium]|nr:hypothetical protein [Victivallales bacterium]
MKTFKNVFLLLCLTGISVAVTAAELIISDITGNGKETICKVGSFRAKPYKLTSVPKELEGLPAISVPRGKITSPGTGFSFKVSAPVTVYLFVDKLYKNPKLEGWEKTEMTAAWMASRLLKDAIYKKTFPAGVVKIPANPERIIPHMAVVKVK